MIPKLQKYGDIYVTDSMKKLRVVPSASFQVGVSVSSGLLEMSMASNQFNKEELAEIFSSYDRKKKYHRLKNGAFITFNEEQKQVMSALSDVMKNYADKKIKIRSRCRFLGHYILMNCLRKGNQLNLRKIVNIES